MKHSSRQTPCPICNRNKDDKCRWGDEMIFCYDGTSFAPPQHLRVGDRVKIGSQTYALFSHQCGFANNSYGFALVDDFNYRFLPYEDKRIYRKKCISITRKLLKKQESLNAFMNAIKAEDCFHEMNLKAFRLNKEYTEKALFMLEKLSAYAVANKRYVVDYLNQTQALQAAISKMSENMKSMNEFEKLHFQ
jgi:hypothetical protein